jgi:hypothetical protein
MLYTSLFLAAATTALAVPMQKRANYDAPPGGDTTILNYALTLEYLERKFYQEGLSKYGETDFCKAGFSKDLYHNFVKIKEDEEVRLQSATLHCVLVADKISRTMSTSWPAP